MLMLSCVVRGLYIIAKQRCAVELPNNKNSHTQRDLPVILVLSQNDRHTRVCVCVCASCTVDHF